MDSMPLVKTSTQRHLFSLDVMKFILALLVITIHACPLADTSAIADFYLSNVLARLAVPLFFASSGYLFFAKLHFTNGKIENSRENRGRLLQYCKKMIILYAAWSVVYLLFSLPQYYQIGWWGIPMIKDFIISFFLQGTHYHLWYLLATIYAVPALYLLLSVFSWRRLCCLIPLLWLFECFIYSYDWLGANQISWLVQLTGHFPIAFDALFRAVPLLFMGLLCYQHRESPSRIVFLMAVLSVAACVFEASLLYFCSPNEGRYSYLLTTPVMTYCLLRYLLGIKCNGNIKLGNFLRKSSVIIYCLHPLVLETLIVLGISSHLLQWLLTTIFTLLLTSLWLCGKQFLLRQR